MRTIKLNKKTRKNKGYNKTGKKQMIRKGGSPSKREPSSRSRVDSSIRKPSNKSSTYQYRKPSTRGYKDKYILRTLTLVNSEPTSSSYGNKTIDIEKIKIFIYAKIKPGYQYVSIPMPPDEGHSIIVHLDDNNNIMIVDWGGEKNRRQKGTKWENYRNFIDALEEIFETTVKYEDIDRELYDNADTRCEINNGQGGCSEYADLWAIRYIGKGHIKILYSRE